MLVMSFGILFIVYILFCWGGSTSKKAPVQNNLVSVPEYTLSINWQEEYYQLDYLTKEEVKRSIHAFHDEYGYPDSIVVDISHRDHPSTVTLLSIYNKRIFNRVSTSKYRDTLFVEPISSRSPKGIPSLYGTINDSLFKKYLGNGLD